PGRTRANAGLVSNATAMRRRSTGLAEPGLERAELHLPAEEVPDQFRGRLLAPPTEDQIPIALRLCGIEQRSGRPEPAEQVFGDDEGPHVGVVNRRVAVQVAEVALKVGPLEMGDEREPGVG